MIKRFSNLFKKIKFFIEMKTVEIKIQEAKKKNENLVDLEYCISKLTTKELQKRGYEVKTGCMCSFGMSYEYTIIIL